jgi:hypothetical protein
MSKCLEDLEVWGYVKREEKWRNFICCDHDRGTRCGKEPYCVQIISEWKADLFLL